MGSTSNFEIEERVLKIAQDYINSLGSKLKELKIDINEIKIERSGQGDTYFSEIEIEFWKGSMLINVLSVIIFMQGKVEMKEHEVYDWLEAEISKILKKE